LLPNDEAEQDRLDCHHHLWRLMIDGPLYRAPIGLNPQRVLDLGTGTGIWAIDFADEFPSALVIGTDLSPIQPTNVPPNVKFYVDDIEGEWTYGPDEKFDFVHGRALGGSIMDFARLYRRIYDNMEPGGWVEMQEYETEFFSNDDPTLSNMPNCKRLGNLVNEASEKAGAFFMIVQEQKQKLIEAGFEDVREDIYKVPVGLWAKGRKLKELGLFQREHVKLSFDSFAPGLLGRVLGWSKDEYTILVAEANRELRDPSNHVYTQFRFIYGRKPMRR
jgi:SAM-dependent methyltransferase